MITTLVLEIIFYKRNNLFENFVNINKNNSRLTNISIRFDRIK